MKRILSFMLACLMVIGTSCKEDDPGATPVQGVAISKATITLEPGKTETLSAVITPSDAADKSITWSSSDAAIATVDAKGVVTAVKEGTATITVASVADNSKKATCTVTVKKQTIDVTEVKLDKTETSIGISETETLTVTVLPANATDPTVTWTSSDETIATVANGVITAVKAGTVTITATSVADNTKKATCEVTVDYIEVNGIKVAVGNLVADGANGMKIGVGTEKSLFFQFGSLVGWSSEDPLAIVVKPEGCTVADTWNKDWTGDLATDNATAGTGDPCRYYLKGTWRLPTMDECDKLFENTGYPADGPWTWDDSSKSVSHESGLEFPALGERYMGNMRKVGSSVSYWSQEDLRFAFALMITSTEIGIYGVAPWAFGLPIRCVKD